MAQRPWKILGVVQMAGPLHPLPAHPKKWLSKFNPDDGFPTK